jgi:hypothetical protein
MRFPDDAEGSSIECPKCHNFFTAAPEEDAIAPATVPAAAAQAQAAGAGPAGPPAPAPRMTTTASTWAPASITALAEVAATPARRLNPWGVCSFLFGSVGLLCASLPAVDFLTIPLAALGLPLAVLGLLLEDERRKGIVLAALGALVCLPVLALAVFWPETLGERYAQRRASAARESKEAAIITSRGDHKPEAPRPLGDDILDMEVGGIRLAGVQVRVLRAYQDQPRLVGQLKKPERPERALTILVRVSNVGTGGNVVYHSWGSAVKAGADHAPTLRDSQGRTYTLKDFGPGVAVQGRFHDKELAPGKKVDDPLVFPQPAAAEYFVLELPASAVGSEGSFRFKIPQEKIRSSAGGPPARRGAGFGTRP